MPQFPEKQQQIVQIHVELVRRVVHACHNPDLRTALEPVLRQSEANGWAALVQVIRLILDGNRSAELLKGLDQEDAYIVDAILLALQDQSVLAHFAEPVSPDLAAPGLATMIDAASKGDTSALTLLASMAEAMIKTEGDMALVGGRLRLMVSGERDANILAKGLTPTGEQLILNILTQLTPKNTH